ncbi:hypothetical protein DFH27DRAFT_303989 [Peziza echinospora]|nr:hypothetical protein DFH27DRAFT_303989 [Peziza echinospora]
MADPLSREYKFLTQDQVAHFLQHGFVVIPGAFTKERAAEWTSQIWHRLGYDPDDKSTWLRDRVNMPSHRQESCAAFAPAAWGAMCELLGGEERVDPTSAMWTDGFIVNLGTPEWEARGSVPARELDNWHVDGDFFVHFLDSPEQGLLVIPIFSDIEPSGGGTMISPDGIGILGRYLRDHPEGVSPRMVPRGEVGKYEGLEWYIQKIKSECTDFREMTGKIGDVVLMHPLMMHSASRNCLRKPRFIINPPVSLKAPFNFDREDPSEYSVVELKTLRELGTDRLEGWRIKGGREQLIPERLKVHAKMREAEERRLRGEKVEATADTGTVDNDRAGEVLVAAAS